MAAAAAQAALSVPAAAQGPVAVLSARPSSARRLDATDDPLFSHLPRFRTTAGAKLFFSGDLRKALTGYDALADLRERLPADFSRWHPLSQAQYLETAHLLPGYILSSQGDRVAMAHAVEGRFPFLDHRVVEFAARIPPQAEAPRPAREAHPARGHEGPAAARTSATAPSSPTARPTASRSSARRRPPMSATGCRPATSRRRAISTRTPSQKLAAKCRTRSSSASATTWPSSACSRPSLWHREFVLGATIASDIPYAVA